MLYIETRNEYECKYKLKMAGASMAAAADPQPGDHDAGIFLLKRKQLLNNNPMTPQQITLVKKSWNQVTPIAQEAGELFYKLLFEAAPGVKHLFKSDPATQSKKLMTMITVVVTKLDSLEAILDDIKKLAGRHDQYGARPEHYAVVGETLIKTLKIGLGDRWNTETEEAWVAAYTILSGAMIANQKPIEKAA